MIKKKICMLGAYAAGKSSLVTRFAKGTFSERYVTTVGVRVEKKGVRARGRDVDLLIWDIHGEDEFQEVRTAYLKGSAGCVLVADGTRADTLKKALDLKRRAVETVGDIPFVLLLNKVDLDSEWAIPDDALRNGASPGCPVVRSSAKDGRGVSEAFAGIVERMLEF